MRAASQRCGPAVRSRRRLLLLKETGMPKRSLEFLSTLAAAFATLLAGTALAVAAGPGDAVLLVAQPDFVHPLYGSTILLAKPLANGGHIGFIINKPTTATLGEVFPEHEPSKKVAEPIFLGGPADTN